MNVLAIDPGPKTSGVVIASVDPFRVTFADEATPIEDIRASLRAVRAKGEVVSIVIEDVTNYGQIVGGDVHGTCKTIGRVLEMTDWLGFPITELTTPEAKRILCGQRNATRAQYWTAARSWIGQQHGLTDNVHQLKGKAAAPGPCYGVKGHAWSAVAIAAAWLSLGDAS